MRVWGKCIFLLSLGTARNMFFLNRLKKYEFLSISICIFLAFYLVYYVFDIKMIVSKLSVNNSVSLSVTMSSRLVVQHKNKTRIADIDAYNF